MELNESLSNHTPAQIRANPRAEAARELVAAASAHPALRLLCGAPVLRAGMAAPKQLVVSGRGGGVVAACAIAAVLAPNNGARAEVVRAALSCVVLISAFRFLVAAFISSLCLLASPAFPVTSLPASCSTN